MEKSDKKKTNELSLRTVNVMQSWIALWYLVESASVVSTISWGTKLNVWDAKRLGKWHDITTYKPEMRNTASYRLRLMRFLAL